MTVSNDDISFEPEAECLVIRVHTRCILTDKTAAFMAIAAELAARPIKAALIDLREVPGPFTFMDRYQVGEAAGRYLAGTPIAAVLTEEQVDPERIGRLVARNRGANIEVFTELGAAQAWVQKYLTPSA